MRAVSLTRSSDLVVSYFGDFVRVVVGCAESRGVTSILFMYDDKRVKRPAIQRTRQVIVDSAS